MNSVLDFILHITVFIRCVESHSTRGLFDIKYHRISTGNPSQDRLIFIMGIHVLDKMVFKLKRNPEQPSVVELASRPGARFLVSWHELKGMVRFPYHNYSWHGCCSELPHLNHINHVYRKLPSYAYLHFQITCLIVIHFNWIQLDWIASTELWNVIWNVTSISKHSYES